MALSSAVFPCDLEVGSPSSLDAIKDFQRTNPVFPDFRAPLNPIPFSGGPLASRQTPCLPLPAEPVRGFPLEPDRFEAAGVEERDPPDDSARFAMFFGSGCFATTA
mmetsp:Transcript_58864/g.88805  ORF Transcript_58864/g.88805 Transcript_58864/m.88805 type:complete len:106 (+) Transcript_58864:310-627(+)